MDLAHELRNEFSVIRNLLWLLRRDLTEASESTLRRLHEISSRFESALRLMESVLEYGRKIEPDMRLIDLSEAVANAATSASINNEARLKLDIPPHITAELDGELIGRLVTNLVRNAFEAMEGTDGVVEVSVQLHGNDVVLEVSDEGKGLPPDARIFEPLFTTKQGGTGLGLSLCRAWVMAMGGEIEAYNRDMGGAAFRVTFKGAAR